MESGILVGQFIIGIICCIFGLKFQKVVVALIGFAIGYLIGDYLVGLFSITGGLDLVIKFGLALVLGACSFSLFELLMSLVVGFSIFTTIGSMFNWIWYGFIIGVIVGIIGGLFVKKYYKLGIILFSSFIGAHLVSKGVLLYVASPYYLVFGIIFIASVIIQMITNKII